MKKILVIGSQITEAGEAQALQDMVAFVQTSMDAKSPGSFAVVGCHLDQVAYIFDADAYEVRDLRNGVDLKEYDLVFFRGKLAGVVNAVSTIGYYLQQYNVPHVNTVYASRRAIGKIYQMFQLVDLHLAIPKTVSASNQYLPSLILQHFTYPVIVKDVLGAHGKCNFLVRDEQQLAGILAEHADVTFMVQEFIENEGDYRVLIVGDKVAVIHRKGQEGSHLNNTSTGGEATLVAPADFPEQILTESKALAQHGHYEIAGVDVIVDKHSGKHYFLEINSQPQLATGAFVEEKSALLADYFTQLTS